MKDEQILAEVVEELEKENKQLKAELKQVRLSLSKANDQISFIGSFRRTFYKFLSIGIVLFLAALIGFPFYMVGKKPIIISHCIIEPSGKLGGFKPYLMYDLMGISTLGNSIEYGQFSTVEAAMDAANQLNCRVELDAQDHSLMDH